MLVIVAIADRIRLWPWFLRYYTRLGATRFAVGLLNGVKNPHYASLLQWNPAYDVHIRPSVVCDFSEFNGPSETAGLNRIREEFAPENGWYCMADLDEFAYFDGRDFASVIKEAESRGVAALHGTFVDRVAADGSFPEPDGNLDDLYPMACDLTGSTLAQVNKFPLARSEVRIESGHHFVATENVWQNAAEIHHFKWVAGVQRVLEARLKFFRQQKLEWCEESRLFLERMSRGVNLGDPVYNARAAAKLGV